MYVLVHEAKLVVLDSCGVYQTLAEACSARSRARHVYQGTIAIYHLTRPPTHAITCMDCGVAQVEVFDEHSDDTGEYAVCEACWETRAQQALGRAIMQSLTAESNANQLGLTEDQVTRVTVSLLAVVQKAADEGIVRARRDS